MDKEFKVGNRDFQLSKLDAFKQFHIVRRIGPLLSDLLPAMKGYTNVRDLSKLPQDKQLDLIAEFASPIMEGLAKLSDEDADLVLYGLLESVEMKQTSGNWMRVSSGKMLMIQDFDLSVLLNLAGRAFIFNLANFFPALPQS